MPTILIDRNKCEGKANCLVCPRDVFELKEPDPAELSWISRLRIRAHGGKQAFAAKPENCDGCGLCVSICPERAITLTEP